MRKPTLISWKKFCGIPPKSTNNLYEFKKMPWGSDGWRKTYSYRLFRKAMAQLLPDDNFLPNDAAGWQGHGLYIEAGIIEEFDLDNTLKGVIDSLQEKYGFNDNMIRGLIAKKKVVGNYPLPKSQWSKQYILIGLTRYNTPECDIFSQAEFISVPAEEIVADAKVSGVLHRAISADWTNVENSSGDKYTVHPLSLYPDVENGARFLNADPEILRLILKTIGPKYGAAKEAFEDRCAELGGFQELNKKLMNTINKTEYERLTKVLDTKS